MTKIPLGVVLRRGLRKRCPRCGVGPLFRKWIQAYDRCSACGVLYQRNYGDIWAFVIITDRIPVMAAIIALYFGFRSTGFLLGSVFFMLLFIPFFATMRERQGLAIALDYVSRVYFPDPSDEIHDGRKYVT